MAQNLSRLAAVFAVNIVAQRFIEKRSPLRWAAHWYIFWGCMLAAAVTFPLSFGWIHFETADAAQEHYQTFVFGIHVFTFNLAGGLGYFGLQLSGSALASDAAITNFLSHFANGTDNGYIGFDSPTGSTFSATRRPSQSD